MGDVECASIQTDEETLAAIVRYGIWLDPLIFRFRPHLVPFAVRDAAARSKANATGAEEWGSPTPEGYFRDDNSLIKEWVKALNVASPNPDYDGRRAKSGFVACHVWRGTHEGAPLHANPLFNSFVPNLVWLPRALARRSDVVGSYTQRALQQIAYKLYREVPVPAHLHAHVEKSWKLLQRRAGQVGDVEATLSRFAYDRSALRRKHQSLESLVIGIRELRRGSPPRKIQSSRYGPGLAKLPAATLDALAAFLEPYVVKAPS